MVLFIHANYLYGVCIDKVIRDNKLVIYYVNILVHIGMQTCKYLYAYGCFFFHIIVLF